jgi:hypothetical protein
MKINRTHRTNKQKNCKTKKGGKWYEMLRRKKTSKDPLAYQLLTEKRTNLPIDDGKRFAELPKIDLRDYPVNPDDDDEDDDHDMLRVDKYDDEDDDEYKTWRDVEDQLPKSSASEACFGLSSSVRSAPCPNSSGDLRSPSEICTEPANNCDLCKLPVPDEKSCTWLGEGALYGMLSVANKSELTNGTELVTVKTDDKKPPMGTFNCDLLKSKIEEKFSNYYTYKNCQRFQQITSYKMYGHFFKKNHLSLLSLAFRLFTNLQTITLGIDPESFKLKEGEHECLEKQNNIKFIIQDGKYGIELVAIRGQRAESLQQLTSKVAKPPEKFGELTDKGQKLGGKKCKTNKNRKKTNKNKSSKK